jgi:hypothetical protein
MNQGRTNYTWGRSPAPVFSPEGARAFSPGRNSG